MSQLDVDVTPHIQEVTVLVAVLVEAETPLEARGEVEHAGLEGLAYEMSEGAWLGQSRVLAASPLPGERLVQRQKELASDGSFFPTAQVQRPYDAESEVLRLQVDQGWSSQTMSMLMHGFLRDAGLLGVFAERMRETAALENAASTEEDSPGV